MLAKVMLKKNNKNTLLSFHNLCAGTLILLQYFVTRCRLKAHCDQERNDVLVLRPGSLHSIKFAR
jgi:hypothetical protein